jgi:cytidylate kinase
MAHVQAEAFLIIGPYGSGKSSVAAEMADLLEAREVPGEIVRWLGWV